MKFKKGDKVKVVGYTYGHDLTIGNVFTIKEVHSHDSSYRVNEYGVLRWIHEYDLELVDSKPEQYKIGIDTFDRMKANASKEELIGFCRGNIDKYAWRKKGCDLEDLNKAKDYIDLWIWTLENK